MFMMIYRYLLAVAARWERLRSTIERRTGRGTEQGVGQGSEYGGSTVEWVVIAAVVFLLAVAVGAKITGVVNEHLAKIK
ncbi:hypothetical protein [Spongiactinospora sp. TRM90649]|uniref:hypothetical protein n=1 Tax=Spongiactinospora sp. TRM90649 TaxID=3031114 RepID=UPI0023F863AB|nr:hypothetical protein [Spongiactinospora sp. TRM90649]MDF5758423.1 hypothetical protein [Spongiactinospora sp. TRM90649]